MEAFLGIDGGTSSIRALLIDEYGSELARCHSAIGGTNLRQDPASIIATRIESLLSELFFGNDGVRIASACVGSAGLESGEDRAQFVSAIIKGRGLRQFWDPATVVVMNDVEPVAACGERPWRVSLIAGTGGNCFVGRFEGVLPLDGTLHYVTGRPMSDWGSATSIALKAMVCVVRAGRGLEEWSLLSNRVLDYFGLSADAWRALETRIDTAPSNRRAVAALANAVVAPAANQGCPRV